MRIHKNLLYQQAFEHINQPAPGHLVLQEVTSNVWYPSITPVSSSWLPTGDNAQVIGCLLQDVNGTFILPSREEASQAALKQLPTCHTQPATGNDPPLEFTTPYSSSKYGGKYIVPTEKKREHVVPCAGWLEKFIFRLCNTEK